MISWLAARSDGDEYGNLVLYQFPKQKLIYGPRQIESRIDQDPEISKQITLWSQSGSAVVRGNLLVIPIEDSLMYVEPLYLQAESSQMPELKRVIVAYENRIVMEEDLATALAKVFGGTEPEKRVSMTLLEEGSMSEAVLEKGIELSSTGSLSERVSDANRLFELAIEAQRSGNWALYGEHMNQLGALLQDISVKEEAEPIPVLETPSQNQTP